MCDHVFVGCVWVGACAVDLWVFVYGGLGVIVCAHPRVCVCVAHHDKRLHRAQVGPSPACGAWLFNCVSALHTDEAGRNRPSLAAGCAGVWPASLAMLSHQAQPASPPAAAQHWRAAPARAPPSHSTGRPRTRARTTNPLPLVAPASAARSCKATRATRRTLTGSWVSY